MPFKRGPRNKAARALFLLEEQERLLIANVAKMAAQHKKVQHG